MPLTCGSVLMREKLMLTVPSLVTSKERIVGVVGTVKLVSLAVALPSMLTLSVRVAPVRLSK